MTCVSPFCQETSGISSCFLHTPPATLILHPAPSAGTPVATVVWWEGDGASVLRLTWLRGRRGPVQGFPCRHYGRCVLDEHIAERPMPPGAHSSQKAKRIEAERNGLEQKSPAGCGSRATFNLLRGSAMRPASRLLPPRQGAFFEKARLRKQGVATMKLGIRPKAEPATASRRPSGASRRASRWRRRYGP
jgi:hypothetical protein